MTGRIDPNVPYAELGLDVYALFIDETDITALSQIVRSSPAPPRPSDDTPAMN